ncbi:hypothetical protein HA402_008754 [Bradysia odoriphaga]|nr:hypothetical protein HA402_008754 [Bradysia odoriphaga]
MSCNLYLSGKKIKSICGPITVSDVQTEIFVTLGLSADDFYLIQNGIIHNTECTLSPSQDIHAELRLLGGKGGFGSMLRAIGAQIEKTTNREACRDLSGRRLRDINEEKRLKTWLDSQKNREQDAEDKQKKKIEKLQAKPKHEFKDEAYEQARTDLTQNIADSVEEGFKKAAEQQQSLSLKRSATDAKGSGKKLKKKKKGALWLGDISSSSETDSDSDADTDAKRPVNKVTVKSSSVSSCPSTSSSADVSEDTSNSSSVDK